MVRVEDCEFYESGCFLQVGQVIIYYLIFWFKFKVSISCFFKFDISEIVEVMEGSLKWFYIMVIGSLLLDVVVNQFDVIQW